MREEGDKKQNFQRIYSYNERFRIITSRSKKLACQRAKPVALPIKMQRADRKQ